MKISNLLTYIPATVDVELNGRRLDSIYVLINLSHRVVLVPDESQYEFLQDGYEDFVSEIFKSFDGIMTPEYTPLQPPKEALEALVAVKTSAVERTKAIIKENS